MATVAASNGGWTTTLTPGCPGGHLWSSAGCPGRAWAPALAAAVRELCEVALGLRLPADEEEALKETVELVGQAYTARRQRSIGLPPTPYAPSYRRWATSSRMAPGAPSFAAKVSCALTRLW